MGKSMGSVQVSEVADLALHGGQKEIKMVAKASKARDAKMALNGQGSHQALPPPFLNLSPQKGSRLTLWVSVLHTEYQPSPEAI